MVIENLTNGLLPGEFDSLINNVTTLTKIFQAVGGLIIAYIIFNVINTIFARKKRNELRRMRQLLERIDRNISKLAKK